MVKTLQLSSDRDPRDVTGDLSVCLDGMQVDPETFASAERERGKEPLTNGRIYVFFVRLLFVCIIYQKKLEVCFPPIIYCIKLGTNIGHNYLISGIVNRHNVLCVAFMLYIQYKLICQDK